MQIWKKSLIFTPNKMFVGNGGEMNAFILEI